MPKTRIMIVEDEVVTAKITQKSLESLGYVVSSVTASGGDAIKKAEEDKPDLILMDIVLEGEMDGIETAEKIHSFCNIPIIYLTSHSDDTILERAKITEPFGYMVKPFQKKELHIAIEMAIYKHKAEEERKKLTNELREAHDNVKTLKGMLPICASCKKIRDDKGYWNQIEVYIKDRSEADFTHGICPGCQKKLYPDLFKE